MNLPVKLSDLKKKCYLSGFHFFVSTVSLVARFISQILTKTLLGASSVHGHWGMSVITPHKLYLPTGD